MLVHHVILADGSTEHREFSREGWEDAMRDPSISRHWGHSPDRCFDPVAEVRGNATATVVEAEIFVPRAMAIEQKWEQIRKIIEESRRPAQLSLMLGEDLD